MSLIIREIKEEEIAAIQKIARASWHQTYEGIIPRKVQDDFLTKAYSQASMKKRMQESHLFVAICKEEIVGFANFTYLNEKGQTVLMAIYLDQGFQGQGIGTAFLTHAIEKLGPIKEIYVDVEKENALGRNFYIAKGFETVKEYTENFDGHLLQTIHMCLSVAQ